MKKEEFYFDSRDNESKIHAVKWIPDNPPKCVVQIVHGMAEYVERYEEFAKFLTDRDILVVGEDHLGHGKSIGNNPPGYFCKRDAATVVVRDVHRLKKMTQEQYPGIPYFIFGHSMGSFITRSYLTKYGKGISGAIISGTGMPPKATGTALGVICAIMKLFVGAKHPSKMLDKIGFGSYNKRIPDAKTPHDWLSVNEENVQKYEADPLCGFLFTVNGFQTMSSLVTGLHNKAALEKIPHSLPVFFISGSEDPVGDYGKGVEQTYQSYLDLGLTDVSMKEYEGLRHELLNEASAPQVMEDVYQWITKHIL